MRFPLCLLQVFSAVSSTTVAIHHFGLVVQQSNRTLVDEGRIVGGEAAKPGEYPWFARATRNNHASWGGCGGSLITKEFVLTAAHCVLSFISRKDGYEIGSLCPDEDENCGQHSEAILGKRVFVHPAYNISTRYNYDFALVKLSRPVSRNIQSVRIDKEGISEAYNNRKTLWVAGFGRTSFGGSLPDPNQLQHVQLRYENNSSCDAKYAQSLTTEPGRITAAMICTSNDNSHDTCNGDSGGPLFDAENRVVVGCVSFGACASFSIPAVYSRIRSAIPWIEHIVCTRSKSGPPPPQYLCGCSSNESRIDVHIRTDVFGGGTAWELTTSPTNQRLLGGNMGSLRDNEDYYHSLCVSNGETYRFIMTYPNFDGFNERGKYTIFVNGFWNNQSNKKFTSRREFKFET